MKTKESRHAATRLRAIEIAFELLQKEGETAVQARRVADAVGCSVGTLYNVFGSLDGVWVEVNALTLEVLHAALDRAVEQADDTDPQTVAIAACEVLLRFADTNAAQWRALLHGPATVDAEAGFALEGHTVARRVRQLFVAAFSVRDPQDAAIAADAVMALIEGLTARVASRRGAGLPVDKATVLMVVAVRRMTGPQ